jgi:hypothetical protein
MARSKRFLIWVAVQFEISGPWLAPPACHNGDMPKKPTAKKSPKLKPVKREPKPDFAQIAWRTVQQSTQGK